MIIVLLKTRVSFKKAVTETALLLLLVTAVLSSIVQHYVIGTLYVIDRAALFYYPLIAVMLCFSIALTSDKIKKMIFIFMIAASLFNFVWNMNTYRTALWQFDSRTEEIITWLENKAAEEKRNIKIDFSWPFSKSFAYYIEKRNSPIEALKSKEDREAVSTGADYYIHFGQSLDKVGYEAGLQKILNYRSDTVLRFPSDAIYILKMNK
jgi:hypothetical protein